MQKGKKVISRSNIYIGTVIKTNKRNIVLEKSTGKLIVENYEEFRNILFTLTNSGYAEDLLYSSPNYPILNISNGNFLEHNNETVTLIYEAYNLDKLLNYLGYYKYLDYKEIIKIRKDIFSGKFTSKNPELFEWNEINFENFAFYRNGIKITNPEEIKARKWEIMLNKAKSNLFQTFIKYNEQLKEFEEIINTKSNNSLQEVLFGSKLKINTFAPVREEGKIKKIGTIC